MPGSKKSIASIGEVLASDCAADTAEYKNTPQMPVPAMSNIVTGRCLNTMTDAILARGRIRMEKRESTGQI